MNKKKNALQASRITKTKQSKNQPPGIKTRFISYAKNNLPKTKKRLVFDILLLVVFAIWLTVVVNDIIRHNAVTTAVKNLGNQLHVHKEFDRYYVQRTCSGGGKGKGDAVYSCRIGDHRNYANYGPVSREQANATKTALEATVKNSKDFKIIREGQYDNERTQQFGYSMALVFKKHGNKCGASIDFNSGIYSEHEFWVGASCQDTRWYEKVYGFFF